MSESELSYQQLDPVGSYGSRAITLVMSLGIVAFAIGAAVWSGPSVTDPVAEFFAIAATAVSALGIAFWSSPLRAPFRPSGFVVVTVAAGFSLVFCALATWDSSSDLVEH